MPAGSSQVPQKQANKRQYELIEPVFDTREFMPYISTKKTSTTDKGRIWHLCCHLGFLFMFSRKVPVEDKVLGPILPPPLNPCLCGGFILDGTYFRAL